MVCTNTEAHADMIQDGVNGFLFERDNRDQLATIINRLLSDPALCGTVGIRARRTIEERFTSERCAKETVKLYKEAMSGMRTSAQQK
jgi:glycosyltransferase involved in cell wall biosynthesis